MLPRPALALCSLTLLGSGCVATVGLDGGSPIGESRYTRAYNRAEPGARYGSVRPVRLGLAGGFGFEAVGESSYGAVQLVSRNLTTARANATDGSGAVRQSLELRAEEVGVRVEGGSSSGLYGAVGVSRREAEGFVFDAVDGSVGGDGYGYLARVEIGRRWNFPYGSTQAFVGGELPLMRGDAVLPSRYAVENGRAVMGADPAHAAVSGWVFGVRVGLKPLDALLTGG